MKNPIIGKISDFAKSRIEGICPLRLKNPVLSKPAASQPVSALNFP
ncbi:hypothetical protein IWQ49_002210 [Labrenzia sp. EL_126]|nr:hypothetical protein [Labrenzia sp. EL_126]